MTRKRYDVAFRDDDGEVVAIAAITPLGDKEIATEARKLLVEELGGEATVEGRDA